MSAQDSTTTAPPTTQPPAVAAPPPTTMNTTTQPSQPAVDMASAPVPKQEGPTPATPATNIAMPSMQTPVSQPAPAAPTSSTEQYACQWQGCTESLSSAETLYEHVCERHVGRKSTNNLCLTCQWGNCRTQTVKRDHITSHIRVHIPLKPHKCEFCGKAFKRPQDLKKHIKTHAEDTVLRTPDAGAGMNGRGGPSMGGYSLSNATSFFDAGLGNVGGHGFQPAPHAQYYHPQSQPQTHVGAAAPYGNVYYSLGHSDVPAHDKKRGFEALDAFFGDLKRRQFDTRSYDAASHRLMSLHAPLHSSGVLAAGEYQPMPAMVSVDGHGHGHGAPLQAYTLPTLSNIRNKADLVSIDHYLEQVSNTIYEGADHMAAAGTGQPGAHYLQHEGSMRSGHSPQSSHMTQHAPRMMSISSQPQSQSPTGTPALTPSSSHSYTSGHSPISQASHHSQLSPIPQTSAGLYPSLPAATGPEHMNHGYPVTTGASASTLGGIYDDDRRRYQGGMLQSARPGSDKDDASMADGSSTPKRGGSPKSHFTSAMIDPALAGSPDAHMSGSGASTPKAKNASPDPSGHAAWLDQVRLLEFLRRCVKDTMSAFGSEEEHAAADDEDGMDTADKALGEHLRAAARAAVEGGDEDTEMRDRPDHEDEVKMHVESEGLYPVLRAVEDV